MPQERHNPFPFPIASEVAATPGTREQKAARNIMVRHIQGVPRRAYLMGDSDHAPILKGVVDLTTAAYALLDKIDWNSVDEETRTVGFNLKVILEDHGCPESREEAEPPETLESVR